MKRLRQYA